MTKTTTASEMYGIYQHTPTSQYFALRFEDDGKSDALLLTGVCGPLPAEDIDYAGIADLNYSTPEDCGWRAKDEDLDYIGVGEIIRRSL